MGCFTQCFFTLTQGRQAMDWVCQKVKDEAADLCRTMETTSADLRRNLETTSADLRRNLETTCKNIEDNMKTMETKFENMIPNNQQVMMSAAPIAVLVWYQTF